MRKRYIDPKQTSSVATESVSTETIITNRPVLSLEEEIVILQEATDLQNEVQAGLEEAIRVEDVSNNILDMADTIEEVEEITPQQAALIDTAAEMAVAGTDTNPDVVIPSMESFIGTQIAVEGWRESAANVWRQIREYVEKLFKMIREAFMKFFSTLPRQLQRIKMLRDVIAAKKKDGKIMSAAYQEVGVVAGVTALSYPGYMVKDSKELQKGLNEIAKLGEWVFGQYAQSVKTQGAIIADELRSFDPAKATDTVEAAAKKLSAANFRTVPNTPNNGYMGCFELKMRRMESKNSLSPAQTLNALRHTYVAIGSSKILGGHNDFVRRSQLRVSLNEVDNILDSVEKLVKEMSSFETSGNYKGMQDTKQAMTAAGNAAQAAWSKHDKDLAQSEAVYAMDVMKSLMNFNTTYAKWTSELPGEFIKRATGAVRASLSVCEKAVALY